MPSADVVIVGAGSAGCVLAARLSEDPSTRVLLLEAGGSDRHPNVRIPAAFAKQFHTKRDWDFHTEPEPHCDGRSLYLPRGRQLGGSSSMNAMLYVRGNPLDYDTWEREGAEGWGWDGVRPYFLKAEDFHGGQQEHHGAGGPLKVAAPRSPRGPLAKGFLASCEAVGIPYTRDYNGPEQDGCSPVQVTQYGGARWSAASAYLRPVMKRSNLEVVKHAHATGLELVGDRVTGVRYRDRRGREHVARAEQEVVLAGGAFGSPQLLLLSGIGPADELRALGIEARHDLPGVGRNLQDHPFVTCIWDLPGGGSLADAEAPAALLEWLLRRSGPLSSTVAEAFAFVRSRAGLPAPDLQFHFAPAYYVDHGAETYDGHAMAVAPVLVNPQSRGSLRLASADPTAKPRILSNTYAEPRDLAAMVAGVRLAREIAGAAPFADVAGRELFPGPEAVDDTEIEAFLRARTELLYHPVGTCRMGASDDADAVVDPQLRVRGLEGLRVCDASVMPTVTRGNTNAPTLMIGERGADLIRGRIAAPVAVAA